MTAEPAAAGSYQAVAGAFSQCKRLDQVEAMAREVIAPMLDSDPADVGDVEVDVHLPDDLAALRRSERLADDARQAATHAQRRAAEQLRAAGLSVRDIGRLLGVSHQRVSQILAREPA